MANMSLHEQWEIVFDHWKVKDHIGEGSSGKTNVYEIVHTGSPDVKSALKIIRLIEKPGRIEVLSNTQREAYETNKQICKDYAEKEVLLMNRLRGRTNIVDYLDHTFVERSSDTGFGFYMLIRMELLEVLRHEIESDRAFSEADALKIGKDICKALILCHSKDILHRDIKPENIFKTDDGNYKLGDFGISRIISNTPLSMASTSTGTKAYAAPEQTSGKYDKRVDIYSLGLVLYELCNQCRLPFVETSYLSEFEARKSADLRCAGKEIPMPSDASAEFARVILKACAFKADDRYQTAEEMLEALEQLTVSGSTTSAERAKTRMSDLAGLQEPAHDGREICKRNMFETVPAASSDRDEVINCNHKPSLKADDYTSGFDCYQIETDERKRQEDGKLKQRARYVFLIGALVLVLLLVSFVWKPWSIFNPEYNNTTIDRTAPTVFISSPLSDDGTRYVEVGGSITFSVEVSDNNALKAVNLYPENIVLDAGLVADITVKGTGNSRTITLSNISGETGEHSVTIKEGCAIDEAGNQSFLLQSESFYITSDSAIPTVNIGTPILSDDKVVFEVYCADNLKIDNLEIRPVDISTMGFVADIEIIGNGATKQIVLTNIQATGNDCYIVIAEGVVTDSTGNRSKHVKSHSFDLSRPALTISSPSDSIVNAGGTVSFTVATCDNVQVTFFGIHKNDIQMNGFTADVEVVEVDDFVRTIIFSNIQSTSDGTKYFVISEGVAKDALGNANKQKNSPGFKVE